MTHSEPTPPRLAVIDLGTNTFHLLIAETDGTGGFSTLHRERHYVKLAEAGIEHIGPQQFARGLATLQHFATLLVQWQVSSVRAIGTAALRTADNGEAFVQQAEQTAGIRIQLIPGEEEARLITRGVQLAVEAAAERRLIMDIGGGSVEFIIFDQDGVYWAESFPVGVAVLYRHFHRSEPISEEERGQLLDFLATQLAPLRAQLERLPTHHLIGAAGTFDVLADLLGTQRDSEQIAAVVDLARFPAFYLELLTADREQRHRTPGIPVERADMIVVAMILVDYILNLMAAQQLTVSAYSLKEGVMVDMLQQQG